MSNAALKSSRIKKQKEHLDYRLFKSGWHKSICKGAVSKNNWTSGKTSLKI